MTRWTQLDADAHQARVKRLTAQEVREIAHPKPVRGNASDALGRLPVGAMNKTEAQYSQLLELRKLAGEIFWWKFEGMTLKLANNTRYTPDFSVMLRTGKLELHEVKSFWRDDARIKIKVAASLYPFRFIAVTKQRKKDGGGWDIEEFKN